MKSLVLYLLSFYQKGLSPFMGGHCRYIPSCSEYMREAVEAGGVLKGVTAGLLRIVRCAPWGRSGYDPYHL